MSYRAYSSTKSSTSTSLPSAQHNINSPVLLTSKPPIRVQPSMPRWQETPLINARKLLNSHHINWSLMAKLSKGTEKNRRQGHVFADPRPLRVLSIGRYSLPWWPRCSTTSIIPNTAWVSRPVWILGEVNQKALVSTDKFQVDFSFSNRVYSCV